MAKDFPSLVRLATAALATLLVAGCVVGDGSIPEPPYQPTCLAYPDMPERCAQPWQGQIVQSCSENGYKTSLHFDRPEVADSLRANLMVLGEHRFLDMKWGRTFRDTAFVCEGGACRNFVVEFRSYSPFPIRGGQGRFEFYEADSTYDGTSDLADWGVIKLDTTVLGACD